jgi:hypothetical protein
MEEDRPEDWTLVRLLLDRPVYIEYLAGPLIEDDATHARMEAGEEAVLKGSPEVRTALYFLHAYSRYGIEVSTESDSEDDTFISWSAVLRMWGPSREELIRQHQEAMQNHEDSEGTSPT